MPSPWDLGQALATVGKLLSAPEELKRVPQLAAHQPTWSNWGPAPLTWETDMGPGDSWTAAALGTGTLQGRESGSEKTDSSKMSFRDFPP